MQNHFHHFHLVFIYAEGDKGVSKTAGTKYFSSKCPFNVHLTLLPLYQLDFFLVPYSPTSTSFLPCCRTHPFHFIITHIFYALPTIRQKKKIKKKTAALVARVMESDKPGLITKFSYIILGNSCNLTMPTSFLYKMRVIIVVFMSLSCWEN